MRYSFNQWMLPQILYVGGRARGWSAQQLHKRAFLSWMTLLSSTATLGNFSPNHLQLNEKIKSSPTLGL